MNYNSAIASVLKELGVRKLLTGYDYIETAVRLRVTNTIQKRDGAMQLYYAVAKKHNTTYKAVERDIRYAIECALSQMVQQINFAFREIQRQFETVETALTECGKKEPEVAARLKNVVATTLSSMAGKVEKL